MRPILRFLQACESSCSMGPVYCFSMAELQEGRMGIWIAGRLDLFKPEAVLYVGIVLVQMMKRWYQMFHVTSGLFGLVQWCILEQDFWGVTGEKGYLSRCSLSQINLYFWNKEISLSSSPWCSMRWFLDCWMKNGYTGEVGLWGWSRIR